MRLFAKVLVSILILNVNLFAQDSLYLITTITGKSVDNPIHSVKSLGDINGDGYNDFSVKELNTNYFDIYFGAKNLEAKNRYRFFIPSELTGSYSAGMEVGDVNNDGFDDFIFSGYVGEIFPEGKLYLYLGKQEIDTIIYKSFNDYGGVGTAGDYNGDGYNDFTLINSSNFENTIGKVYLFLGGETIADTPFVTFVSDSMDDSFSNSALLDGDLNGDGYNDLLITVQNTGGVSYRKSYILISYGNSSNLKKIDTLLSSSISYAPFASTYVSDVNGDGFDDLLLLGDSSKPVLYFGAANFDTTNNVKFNAYKAIDNFGYGFGSIGDINNDGFSDFAINIKNFINKENVMVSKLNIYLGSATVDTIPDFSLEGENKWGEFGRMVGNLGDINGDGYNEFYVLAPGYPDSEHPLGKIYIYSMKKFIVGVNDSKLELPQTFKLYQNYPNPFNPTTTIAYQLPEKNHVLLKIYNALGEEVATLVNVNKEAGYYNVSFNASNLPSGLYLYKLTTRNFTKARKMLLIK